MLEIKDYVARARSEPTETNIKELWRAVFRLQAWYFLPAEAAPGPATPTVLMVDGRPWLLSFTNFRRLRDLARELGRVEETTQELSMLVLNPMESMAKIREHAEHIEGVIFNPRSEESFRAPIAALDAYASHFGLETGVTG